MAFEPPALGAFAALVAIVFAVTVLAGTLPVLASAS
jgi:hypothetical protein